MADGGQRTVKDMERRELHPADSDSESVPSPSAARCPPFTSDAVQASDRPPLTQIKWHCRRGMRELDVVLERYLQQRYATAPLAEQRAFEALLELPDPQLFAYLVRRETPADPDWMNVISQLAVFEP
jgi:antitoxin CptB